MCGENGKLIALRQQLAIYKRKQRRSKPVVEDRWFWIGLARFVEKLTACSDGGSS
jgi:hypothetical protein